MLWRAWVAILHVLVLLVRCRAQQGQNYPPEGGVDIYASVILDHLISVDDNLYQFEAIALVFLSWRDPGAEALVAQSTAAAANGSQATCQRPCSGTYLFMPGDRCCDGIFLPNFALVNARGLDQNRLVRYGILVRNDTVGWWVHLQGTFYTAMTFKAFPFDSQMLPIQLSYADRTPDRPVRVKLSSSGQSLYQPSSANPVPKWTVAGVWLQVEDFGSGSTDSTDLTPSLPDDPWPLRPRGELAERFTAIYWQEGFVIWIQVNRTSVYYIFLGIVPQVIVVWLALLVFAIEPKHLDSRLGIVVTLFLSLMAVGFVVQSELPQSNEVTPTLQLSIISYCLLAAIALASIGVFFLVSIEKRRAKEERLQVARRQFNERWEALVAGAEPPPSPRSAAERGLAGGSVASSGLGGASERRAGMFSGLRVQNSEHYAGMGVMREGDGEGDDSPRSSDSDRANVRWLRHRTMVRARAAAAAAAPAPAADASPEQAGSGIAAAAGKAGAAGAAAGRASLGWLRRQGLRLRAMREEVAVNHQYAAYLAARIDKYVFIFVLLGYNAGVIILFSVQSTYNTTPPI